MSLLTGYFTLSFSIGLLVFCFFRLLTISHNKINLRKNRSRISLSSHENRSNLAIQTKWLTKKYEFLFDDFKSPQKNQFFFAYWITAFNVIYILLIFCLQSVPVLQCLSIVILVLVFILFPAIIQESHACFSSFLQFLMCADCSHLQFGFSNKAKPEWWFLRNWNTREVRNLGDNYEHRNKYAVSLGVLAFGIYKKCKSRAKNDQSNKQKKTEHPKKRSGKSRQMSKKSNEHSKVPAPQSDRDSTRVKTKSKPQRFYSLNAQAM